MLVVTRVLVLVATRGLAASVITDDTAVAGYTCLC